MSQPNPYEPGHPIPQEVGDIRKVKVRTIQLFRRSFDLLGDQYWLFLGITVVAMLLASAVPLGLIIGPVLVGVYCCYIEKERWGRTEFGTMFKGFENFLEPFLASLVIIAVSLVVMLPLMIGMFAAVLIPMIQAANAAGPGNAAPEAPVAVFVTMIAFYPIIIAANILIALPFLFTFQLIADRNVKAIDAVKLSIQGLIRNFWGVLWCMIVVTFISFLGALMCYIPLFLLLPITFGVFYLLYRDIYGPLPPATDAVDAEVVG